MDFSEYRDIIKGLNIGKKLPDSIYIHESVFGELPEDLTSLVLKTADTFKVKDKNWNIIKFYKKDFKITYLNYPDFEVNSYPELKNSQIVDLEKQTTRKLITQNLTTLLFFIAKKPLANNAITDDRGWFSIQ